MAITTKQANFVLPQDLLEELRKTVNKRQQSRVVAEALRHELKRIKLKKALEQSFGAWQGRDHPELKQGPQKFIRTLRKTSRWNLPK